MGTFRVDRVCIVNRSKTAGDLPDLERIRRNWARDAPFPDRGPDRLAAVPTPRDPYEAGRVLLARLQAELSLEFAEQLPVLRPFVERVVRQFRVMGEKANSQDGSDAAAIQAAREEFMVAIRDLEDLCEVFALVNR